MIYIILASVCLNMILALHLHKVQYQRNTELNLMLAKFIAEMAEDQERVIVDALTAQLPQSTDIN